ncbi:MAG: hypothetical protein RMK80_05475 [Pseudobdellovibrionaceae bacterium]|nr:hypothetical protein [Pseudobdellovibrionaceae bacterium]
MRAHLAFYKIIAVASRKLYERPYHHNQFKLPEEDRRTERQSDFNYVLDGIIKTSPRSLIKIILDTSLPMEIRLRALDLSGFYWNFNYFPLSHHEIMGRDLGSLITIFLQREEHELLARLIYLISERSKWDPDVFSYHDIIDERLKLIIFLIKSNVHPSLLGKHPRFPRPEYSMQWSFLAWFLDEFNKQLTQVRTLKGSEAGMQYLRKMMPVLEAVNQHDFKYKIVVENRGRLVDIRIEPKVYHKKVPSLEKTSDSEGGGGRNCADVFSIQYVH